MFENRGMRRGVKGRLLNETWGRKLSFVCMYLWCLGLDLSRTCERTVNFSHVVLISSDSRFIFGWCRSVVKDGGWV